MPSKTTSKKITTNYWSAKKMASRGGGALLAAMASSSSSSSSAGYYGCYAFSSRGGSRSALALTTPSSAFRGSRSPSLFTAFANLHSGHSILGSSSDIGTATSIGKSAAVTSSIIRMHTALPSTPSSSSSSTEETVNSSTSINTSTPRRVKTASAQASDETVSIKGWVRTVRRQKTVAFVEVNDGSSLGGIQCVLPLEGVDDATMEGTSASSTTTTTTTTTTVYCH